MIVYGLPGSRMVEEAMIHDFELGGCIFSSNSPTHVCRACGHYFIEMPRRQPGEDPEAPPA